MESSAVLVLMDLVKALFTQAKEEMEEARNKLAEVEQARRLLLSKTVVNTKFPS